MRSKTGKYHLAMGCCNVNLPHPPAKQQLLNSFPLLNTQHEPCRSPCLLSVHISLFITCLQHAFARRTSGQGVGNFRAEILFMYLCNRCSVCQQRQHRAHCCSIVVCKSLHKLWKLYFGGSEMWHHGNGV